MLLYRRNSYKSLGNLSILVLQIGFNLLDLAFLGDIYKENALQAKYS